MAWRAVVLAALVAAFAPGPAPASPAVDYVVHCQGCHLADGSATPGRVPALAGSVGRLAAVAEGRAYLVRVPGAANAPLSDAALAELLNWVVARFDPEGLPPDFAPYTGEEVSRLRRPPLTDVISARRRVVEALESAAAGASRPDALQ